MSPEPLGYRSRHDDEGDPATIPVILSYGTREQPLTETAGILSLWCFGIWAACLCFAVIGAVMTPPSDPGLDAFGWFALIGCSGILLIPVGFISGIVGVFGGQRRRLRSYLGMMLNGLVLLVWVLLKLRMIRL